MTVTLQELCTIAVNTISSICSNITNYNSISSEFKSGYSIAFDHNRSKATFTLTNPINSVDSNTVNSQLSSFLSDNGFTSLSAELTPSTIISVYTLLAVFTSARVNLVASQFSVNKYICYINDDVTYDFDSASILTTDSDIIFATEGLSASYYIQRIIRQSIKSRSLQYRLVLSGYSWNDGYRPTNVTTPAIVYIPHSV